MQRDSVVYNPFEKDARHEIRAHGDVRLVTLSLVGGLTNSGSPSSGGCAQARSRNGFRSFKGQVGNQMISFHVMSVELIISNIIS